MAGHQHFVCGFARKVTFAVTQRPGSEGRVDAHLVLGVGERVQLTLRQAESPGLPVVRRAIRDAIRALGQRVEVLLELRQGHPRPHRHAVADHMEIGFLEVHDAVAGGVLHPRVTDVPFVRDRPVEHRDAGRNLVEREWKTTADPAERFAHAVAGDAAAKRIELLDAGVHLSPEHIEIELPASGAKRHGRSTPHG